MVINTLSIKHKNVVLVAVAAVVALTYLLPILQEPPLGDLFIQNGQTDKDTTENSMEGNFPRDLSDIPEEVQHDTRLDNDGTAMAWKGIKEIRSDFNDVGPEAMVFNDLDQRSNRLTSEAMVFNDLDQRSNRLTSEAMVFNDVN